MADIGKSIFDLPSNTVKKETSFIDKLIIKSHDNEGKNPIYFDEIIERRIHTQSVKIKFFIVGYRILTSKVISYIGKWVELEPNQIDFMYPIPSVKQYAAIENTYFLGFYPYVKNENDLHIRLKLTSYPIKTIPSELYIEKITIMDSEFDSKLSWLTDDTILPFYPIDTTEPPEPPQPPVTYNSYVNNNWIY